jgi:benzoyl-CoA-dihydrodiol lyase
MAENKGAGAAPAPINFETHPDRYAHWDLTFDGEVATLGMNINEEGGLFSGYTLKSNSYDLGVDIELADALQRIRFEHPEIKSVVVTGAKDKIFCAGANIFMLGQSSHPFKVNFCKFTNETRLYIEDASENSGIKFVCATNGTCAGGGYELALACDEILLIDDSNSAVSLPEVPLLGVLPGTGGLTRVVDKRKVRRDRADFFCTVAEGIKGRRAAKWNLVDDIAPKSKWDDKVKGRAAELAKGSDRPGGEGVKLDALKPEEDGNTISYRWVTLNVDPEKRMAEITMRAPTDDPPESGEKMQARGADLWHLRAFRELDDAILRLRMNHLEVGLVTLRTEGDPKKVLAADKHLVAAATGDNAHWFAREVLHLVKRVLKRVDLTSRTFAALIEPGSCFAGCMAELVWAADRSYMLDDPDADEGAALHLSPMNHGALPMSHGLSRLQAHFFEDDDALNAFLDAGREGPVDAEACDDLGAVTFMLDDIDYPDETRLFFEERASLSPDALTGMEASLRFPGPETLESKIFARLSAWQNWIFIRPNATGEAGALTTYGSPERPVFDFRRC